MSATHPDHAQTVIQRPTRVLRNSNTQPAINNPNDSIPKYLAVHLQKMQPTLTLPSAIQPTNLTVAYHTVNLGSTTQTETYPYQAIYPVIYHFTNRFIKSSINLTINQTTIPPNHPAASTYQLTNPPLTQPPNTTKEKKRKK